MIYNTGDIVTIEVPVKKFKTVLVANISIANEPNDNEKRYYGYTENQSSLIFKGHQVVSRDGTSKDIITDHTIKELLDVKTLPNEFFKCVAIHLIRTTDKYDLQILSKCNQLKPKTGANGKETIQTILDKLYFKLQLKS